MPSFRKAKKPKVQIDADWLLGPDTPATPAPVRGSGLRTAFAILLLFSGVGAVAYYWEPASHQVLKWQWERWLHADETDEDTLAALIALGDTVDDSTILLIQQLQSENATRRAVAFQVIKTQCESPSFRKMEELRQNQIVESLERWKPIDEDQRMMREWIAARMTTLLASSNPAKMELRKRLTQILDSGSNSIGAANGRSMLLAGARASIRSETVSIKPAIPSLPNPSLLPNPPTIPRVSRNLSEGSLSDSPITHSSVSNNSIISNTATTPALSDTASSDTTLSNTALSNSAATDPPIIQANTVPGDVSARPELPMLPNELRSPVATEEKPMASPGQPPALQPSASQPTTAPREPTRIRIGSESNIRTVANSRPMSLSDAKEPNPLPNKKMSVVINVKPKRSVEQLLKSLEQVADDEVAAIVEELEAQGFSELHVDLAIALARGESEERLEALSALTNNPTINPLPWLAWVSESEDQATKLKAIAMLGSTADPEAIRILRIIEQRASDPRVASQIQQALQINGAATSTTR